MTNENNLIWLDLEMTGLNPSKNVIIEIATLVTDSNLNVLAEGPVFAIHQPDEALALMDEWNVKQHGESGLVARVKQSKISVAMAEIKTLEFLKQYVPEGISPMCGNSICLDRQFLSRYMPTLVKYFHYRNLDVSTLKELAKRWAKEVYDGVQKTSKHLAMDDIKESIDELRYYRTHFIKD
ncbi:MAG: oligoribonuclease [Proteobacteria bacterium]|nr:oligoribonuclease [Pseudomonadota bacterium]